MKIPMEIKFLVPIVCTSLLGALAVHVSAGPTSPRLGIQDSDEVYIEAGTFLMGNTDDLFGGCDSSVVVHVRNGL